MDTLASTYLYSQPEPMDEREPTVADLLAIPELNLRLKTESARLDGSINWFSISELPDPSPFLDERDILLTMCLMLDTADLRRVDQYVGKLADRNLSAIGVSVGPAVLDAAPPSLVAAAERHGIPVFEVPVSTRFVGVTRAISAMREEIRAEAQRRALDGQRRMTMAAASLTRARQGVVRELAAAIKGWAMVADPAGIPVEESGAAQPEWLPLTRTEIERMRPKGLMVSSSMAEGDTTISVLPLGLTGSPHAYLAAAHPTNALATARGTILAAVSLLSLVHEQTVSRDASYPRLRQEATRQLLSGDVRTSDIIDRIIHGPRRSAAGEDELVVIVAAAPGQPEALIAELDGNGGLDTRHLAVVDGLAVALVPPPEADAVVAGLSAVPGCLVGSSYPVARAAAAEGLRAAREALTTAQQLGRRSLRLDRRDIQSPLELADRGIAQAWARAILHPLADAPHLMTTLRRFLEHHGQVLPAAAGLGIHRQTVRARIAEIEGLLGLSLRLPATRARLWLALEAVE